MGTNKVEEAVRKINGIKEKAIQELRDLEPSVHVEADNNQIYDIMIL